MKPEPGDNRRPAGVPLPLRITLGAMFGFMAGSWVYVRGAMAGEFQAAELLLALVGGAAVGGLIVYFFHRFRGLGDVKRWAATGGAVGLLFGALSVDLDGEALWAIPLGGIIGAALAVAVLVGTDNFWRP